MIEIIPGLPSKVAAFDATGKVTADDYTRTINPIVKRIDKELINPEQKIGCCRQN